MHTSHICMKHLSHLGVSFWFLLELKIKQGYRVPSLKKDASSGLQLPFSDLQGLSSPPMTVLSAKYFEAPGSVGC